MICSNHDRYFRVYLLFHGNIYGATLSLSEKLKNIDLGKEMRNSYAWSRLLFDMFEIWMTITSRNDKVYKHCLEPGSVKKISYIFGDDYVTYYVNLFKAKYCNYCSQ